MLLFSFYFVCFLSDGKRRNEKQRRTVSSFCLVLGFVLRIIIDFLFGFVVLFQLKQRKPKEDGENKIEGRKVLFFFFSFQIYLFQQNHFFFLFWFISATSQGFQKDIHSTKSGCNKSQSFCWRLLPTRKCHRLWSDG